MRRAPFIDDEIIRFLEERESLPPADRRGAIPASSLEQLYRTQSARLSKFFRRRAEKQDVQDLVHDAFARLAGMDRACSPVVERPEAYLSTVATNLLRDRARNAARRALEKHEAVDPDTIRTEDPHHRLEQRDALARIDEALATLSPRRRQIFLLHRLDHLTYAEIGDVVGMSEKGVKKQMAKALYQLRCALGDI
jgi:RNA polymerase sigma factor (sigma-70 family)